MKWKWEIMNDEQKFMAVAEELRLVTHMGTTKDDFVEIMRFLHGQLQEAQADNKRLTQLLVKEIHFDKDNLDIKLGGEGAMMFMNYLVDLFKMNGGENFLTWGVEGDGHRYAITIQNSDREITPATKLEQLQAENEALQTELSEGDSWMQRAKEYAENGGCLECFGTDETGHLEGCCVGQLEAENAALRANLERYKLWVNDLQSGMYVNCVYCGHRYGPEDEIHSSMANALKEHIEHCPEHPMSKLKADNAALRADNAAVMIKLQEIINDYKSQKKKLYKEKDYEVGKIRVIEWIINDLQPMLSSPHPGASLISELEAL